MSSTEKCSTAVIVGHGPSLKTAGLGPRIDACDKVIRLKNCYYLLAEPQNYGTRTDVMCSSTEVLHTLPKVKASEYWGYPKHGKYNQAPVWQLERRVNKPVHIPLDLTNLWNCFFLELGGRHSNVSTGMGAIVIALDRFKPEVLYLAGFDTLLDPKVAYASTVPTQFNAGGTKDTGHDWETENQMLPFLAAHFGAEITDLAGSYHVSPSGIRTVWKALPGDAEGAFPGEDSRLLRTETRH
jgi:hypothetical protein